MTETFSVNLNQSQLLDDELMDGFQEAMNSYQEEMVAHIQGVADQLGVTWGCAADVVYLRTRSRWTQGLEDELIRRHKEGTLVNINEFG